jgi:hypothetical protein
VSDWGEVSQARLSAGQVVTAICAVLGIAQVVSVLVGAGATIPDVATRIAITPILVLIVGLGARAVYLALNHPSGAAWVLLPTSLLCVVGWFTILAAPIFLAAFAMAVVTARRYPGLDLRVKRQVLQPVTTVGIGRVAAVVRLVQHGKPVTYADVTSALEELESLWHDGVIDEDSYREYGGTLSHVADSQLSA